MALLSVVMAVCNAEKYIEQAVQSILHQTFADFELIIVNDGSRDDSKAIIEAYSRWDPRIVLVHQENVGLTASLKIGLSLARGVFVARMDADDISTPDRFQKQISFLENHPEVVLLGGEVELISEEGFELGVRHHAHSDADVRRRLLLGDGGALTHPAVMFRRSVAIEIGDYDIRFSTCQDLDLFIRLSEKGKVANLPDTILMWRQHPQSINQTKYSSWADMKRMAISGAIERMGIENYAESLFPYGDTIHFPASNLALFQIALANRRMASANHFLKLALKDPLARQQALEIRIEQQILRLWYFIRNMLLRHRINGASSRRQSYK